MLRSDFVEDIINKKSHGLVVHFVIYCHSWCFERFSNCTRHNFENFQTSLVSINHEMNYRVHAISFTYSICEIVHALNSPRSIFWKSSTWSRGLLVNFREKEIEKSKQNFVSWFNLFRLAFLFFSEFLFRGLPRLRCRCCFFFLTSKVVDGIES